RARVQSDDELGRLARSFNTMLARVTDMAVADIEARESLSRMEQDLSLQGELKAVNERLAAHVDDMELLLEVSNAISGTLDLPELLQTLGRLACTRFGVSEFSVMLIDDATHQLVIEAVGGAAPRNVRGIRFHLGEGVAGEVAARGETIFVGDVSRDPRYLQDRRHARTTGSFLSVPLKSKGRVLGVMNFNRPGIEAFSSQEIRLAEAIAAQAALAIANARLYQQTLELSFTDPLTGVPNRRQLFLGLENELSRALRFGEPLSLLMI